MGDRAWTAETDLRSARKRGGQEGELETSIFQPMDDETSKLAIPYVNANVNDNANVNVNAASEETHTRSLVKGFTWRIIATMTTVSIAWMVTGEVATAFQIGFVEFFAKIGIYYGHERIWAKVRL
jgi:uncharacterized membrane protein